MSRVDKNLNKKEIRKKYKFWSSQPVPKMIKKIEKLGPIEKKEKKEILKNFLNLPPGFEWYAVDLKKKEDLESIYNLLSKHYVEDDDNMFRFNYSMEFLKWALTPPGFLRKWHLTIRLKKTKKIVACITAIPARICVNEEKINMVEINFLCVHKKLRNKRLAPVLIREITRRVNCEDVWQASYTAGVIIPRPIARNQYWHRSLSPRKLVEIGFSGIPRNSSIDDMIVLEKIPSQNTISLRPMNKNDCSQVCKLLEDYFRKFKYAPTLNESQIAHWFLPRKDIISSFVIENFEGSVTDFFSFYSLSSHVIGNYKYSILNAVYSYYNIAVSISWKNLMLQALIIAKQVKK